MRGGVQNLGLHCRRGVLDDDAVGDWGRGHSSGCDRGDIRWGGSREDFGAERLFGYLVSSSFLMLWVWMRVLWM